MGNYKKYLKENYSSLKFEKIFNKNLNKEGERLGFEELGERIMEDMLFAAEMAIDKEGSNTGDPREKNFSKFLDGMYEKFRNWRFKYK